MKTLITYYSFEGNCRELSKLMANATGAAIQELRPVRETVPRGAFKKYLIGGKAALFKQTTPLQPLDADPRAFDLVVVGGPVWAFDITPAVRTFLSETDWTGKRVALFVMHGGGKGKALATMRELIAKRGGTVVAAADFLDLRRAPRIDTRQLAVQWITRVTEKGGAGRMDSL